MSSVTIPKRIDKCANVAGGCQKWCLPGEFYCSGHCRAAADERDAEHFLGGSLERYDTGEHDPPDHPTVTQRNWRR
jgi:hypothetical protein